MLNIARPFFWLLFYLVILYVRPQEYVPSLMGTPVVPVSLTFATGIWLLAQEKLFDAPQHGLMLALTAAIALSVLATGWVTGAVNAVTKFVPTLLVFYLVATSVDSMKRFREICLVLSALSVVIAVHGMEQIATEGGVGWTGATTIEGRITYLGLLNDPNDLSMAFLMSLPLTLYLARVTGSFVLRLLSYAAAGVTLYGIYLCDSRGSILGLAAMLTLYVGRRFGIVRGLLVLPVVIGILTIFSPSRSAEMSFDDESAAGRVDAWYEGFDMFFSHPLFGVGAGLFTDHNQLTAHNSFVLAIAELGLVGYFVWFAILAISGVMLWRLLALPEPSPAPTASESEPDQRPFERNRDPQDPPPSWVDIQAAAAALSYAYVGALVAAFFLSRTYVVFLYLMVALVVAVYQLAGRHWPALTPVRVGSMFGRLLALALASIAGLWLLTRVLLSVG